jgi:hypothetical protein
MNEHERDPERVYLQHLEGYPDTWSDERLGGDEDTEYIRADLYGRLVAALYKYTEDSPDEYLAEFLSDWLEEEGWPPKSVLGVTAVPDTRNTHKEGESDGK